MKCAIPSIVLATMSIFSEGSRGQDSEFSSIAGIFMFLLTSDFRLLNPIWFFKKVAKKIAGTIKGIRSECPYKTLF